MKKISLFLAVVMVLTSISSSVAMAAPLIYCTRCEADTPHRLGCGADSSRTNFGTHLTSCDYYTQRKWITGVCLECGLSRKSLYEHNHVVVHSICANVNVCPI